MLKMQRQMSDVMKKMGKGGRGMMGALGGMNPQHAVGLGGAGGGMPPGLPPGFGGKRSSSLPRRGRGKGSVGEIGLYTERKEN